MIERQESSIGLSPGAHYFVYLLGNQQLNSPKLNHRYSFFALEADDVIGVDDSDLVAHI